MANLVPLSKSPLVVKKQIPNVIKNGKDNKIINKNIGTDLLETYKKIVTIDNVLKKLFKFKENQTKKERVKTEQQNFEKKEKELEKKKPKPEKGVELPSPPKMGFFDWIKNFITQTILGFFAVRLTNFLPQLLKILPLIISVSDFFVDWGGKLLDGLITFVDWGYKAYDGTREFLKNLGGNNLVSIFDKFSGAIGGLIDVLIFASVAAMGMDRGGDGGPETRGGRKGFDSTGRRVGRDAQRRYAQRFGKDQFVDRFGKRNLRNLQGGSQRGIFQKGARSAFMGLSGKQGAKAVLKFVKPLVNKIPIIGGLIEFGLSWALGEPVGKAAFRGIGAVLVGAIGTAIGGPIGAFLGSWAGGEAGGLLYDMFFNNKKPQSKVVKAAKGGKPSTRGGKLVSGPPKRTIKKRKTSRTLIVPPTSLKPGSAVGGEKKIKELYPEPKDKTKMNPFDLIKTTYERFSKSKGIERLASLALKPLVGDRVSYVDYKSSASVLNDWINHTMTPGTLAYAGGGEVRMDQVISGEDYSNVLAKSLQTSMAPEVDKTIQDLMKQLMLKKEEPDTKKIDKTDPTISIDDEFVPGGLTKGQWGPLLDLISGKESGGNYEAMYPSTTLPGATKMTIAEVARRATGAVGKYQQLPQYLVGRAKSAGLNPDKDLYSPENQEKIIINVNIKGRGGEKWLNGRMSDEQFMQGLSQEFASLPNAQGKFYYSGQRSSIRPEQIKEALSKVKRGGYSKEEIAKYDENKQSTGKFKVIEYITGDRNHPNLDIPGHGMPGNYHDHIAFASISEKERAKRALISSGIRIGSELRKGDPGYHGRNLAIDIPGHQWGGRGAIGSREFAGSRRVRQILGIGMNAPRFHGGPITKTGYLLGHKGEYVIDADSVKLFGDIIPNINSIENKSQLVAKAPSIIEKLKAISNYTEDDLQIQIVYIPVPDTQFIPISSGSGSAIIVGSENIDSDTDVLNVIG